jgi:4-alpha-glucanotransferase
MHRESFYEKQQFWKYLGFTGEPRQKSDAALITAAIEKAADSKSVFSIQLIIDWLSMGPLFDGWKREEMRVNTPGTMTDKNWSIVMPVSLEDMISMDINEKIKGINTGSGRI